MLTCEPVCFHAKLEISCGFDPQIIMHLALGILTHYSRATETLLQQNYRFEMCAPYNSNSSYDYFLL